MAPKKPEGFMADILADINSGGKSGNTLYLKPGDTQIKLLMPAGDTDPRKFYRRYQATFKGELFPYFIVCGVVTQADEDGVEDPKRIRYIKFPKSVMSEVANLMQKKWELFNIEGPQIVVTQGKKAGKTAYSVQPVLEKFDAAGLTFPEQTIDEAAQEQEVSSAEMDAKKDDAAPF